ncbi:MAG TPA: AAA family ATPase, partial [Steroidobacteraceae bacterium]|nr:AAA family ATPase [Steroidobacteraceae bacterium]
WIDVADEVAFLVADLQASGAELHAHAFLHGYLEQSGDFDACRVLDLFRAHRSLVRAKVATLSPDGTGDFLRYLSRARAALEPKRPRLVLMSGMSGSGKTWLAQRLAPLLGAVHMRSDIERRRLAGIDMRSSSHSALDGGAYAPLMNEAVYERLAVCAQAIMEGGFTAIVDATFQRRMDRSRLCEVAARLGARTWLIHCHAPDSILEERINQRQRRHEDPSEADLSVLRAQSARFEPIGSDEPLTLVDASTDQAGILERVALALGLTP